MNLTFARELIENPGELSTRRLFQRANGVFWVDWREASEDIVNLAAQCIGDKDLAADWIGDKLRIRFRGHLTEVPTAPGLREQDAVLLALNRAVDPEYEIRFVKASDGGDTLAFLPLGKELWSELQDRFGAKVDTAFVKIQDGAFFFGPDEPLGDEVERQLKAQIRKVKFARVNFRLRTKLDQYALIARAEFANESRPLIDPLFGDLVLTYFHDLRPTYPVVAEAELHEYSLSRDELRELALRNASEAWRNLGVRTNGSVVEVVGADRGMTACTALYSRFWDEMERIDGKVIAAFPHRDLVIYAPATDPACIPALRQAVGRVDFYDPLALSRQLYRRHGDGWEVIDA